MTIEMLKFDVEFHEWDSINAMLEEGSLRNVKQIAIELHAFRDDVSSYVYFSRLLQGLLNAGFEKWFVEDEQRFSAFILDDERYFPQTNVHFINVNYMNATKHNEWMV